MRLIPKQSVIPKAYMLELTNEQHKNIKTLAAQMEISMKELILTSVAELASKLEKSKKKGWQEIK